MSWSSNPPPVGFGRVSGVINWPTYHSTHYPNSDCDTMATKNDNKSPKELILAAKDHVEGQLLKELQCLSRDDLECYVKSRDEERAFHIMTEHLQSHGIHQFKDDDIRYQCTFIGNTLHHRSRDLAAEARANLRKTSLRSFSTPTSTSKSKNGDAKDAPVPAPVSTTTASDDAKITNEGTSQGTLNYKWWWNNNLPTHHRCCHHPLYRDLQIRT